MRLSFVASLLFSGSIGLFELASGKTSFRQTAWQHYNDHQGEVVQRGKKQIRQLLSQAAQTQSADAKRELQFTDAPTGAPLCNSDGSVNFESEDFPQPELYGTEYNTMCTCMQQNNEKELTDAFDALDISNITAYVEGFNTLVGMAYSFSTYTCVNGCEACLESGICGLLETTETLITEYTKSNFTIDQIGSGVFDDSPFVTNFTYEVNDCFTYTSGTSLNGKLCFGVDLDDPEELFGDETECFVEYDGVRCNSCIFRFVGAEDCLFVDCTNIDSAAMIDSCNGTGFVGPFIIVEATQIGDEDTNFTVGSCDLSAPTAPVALPSAPTPTAPVASPSAPTPTAPSSGSFTIGVALNVLVLVASVAFLASC